MTNVECRHGPLRTAAPFVGVLSQAAIDAELVGRTIVLEPNQLSPVTTGQCGADWRP